MTTLVLSANTTAQNATADTLASTGISSTEIRLDAPTSNVSGFSNILRASYGSDGLESYRFLIGFGLSDIPADQTISSATLYLYRSGGNKTSADVPMYRTLADWVNTQATWNNRITSTAWTTAGAAGSGTDRAASAFATFADLTTDVGYKSVDVTTEIQSLYAASATEARWVGELTVEELFNRDCQFVRDTGTDGTRPELVIVYEAAGGTEITSSGTPAADSATASGTAERVLPSSGTPASDAATASGTSEREIPGSGTPSADASTLEGTAERVLSASGELISAASSTSGTASLQLRLILTAANNRELRDENGAAVANLASIAFEWYDKDTDTEGNPAVSGTFSTNASGEATIQLPGTSLNSGDFGLLVLEHPTDPTIRGVYRIPVT